MARRLRAIGIGSVRQEESTDRAVGLRRQLGLLDATAISVGIILDSGIWSVDTAAVDRAEGRSWQRWA